MVVCIDADCFYAQVEHRRLGVPKDKVRKSMEMSVSRSILAFLPIDMML